ncbi:hypothetical protein RFI_01163 [Reticulomyxa filosa]|uniref:Uncharacterized protein n=1 Tax=Reticulomyxa filosa TaxID=46433 RepID=X6PCX9_RETFI|nr:hypothetical protein RFI_01163 [Reticulomyxa filosa]|eukprot:ETO35899.1 hypothetical protein RFI_01163 [Reticulomyxa filosa]
MNTTNNLTPFETLAPLPLPFFQAQCIAYKQEILTCGGNKTNECYSYHTIRNQYKLICSYPKDVILHGHCVLDITNNNNKITLLSFGGLFKHTLIMNYTSVWNNDKKNEYVNEWIPLKDNNNNTLIYIDKGNYEGARAIIGGSNNYLLFITYSPQNISIFNLDTFQYIYNNTFLTEENWISYHSFISKTENKNEMILFYKNTGLIINYNENNNTLQFHKISICDDISLLKRYSCVYVNDDMILFFGEWNNSDSSKSVISNIIYQYSLKKKSMDEIE